MIILFASISYDASRNGANLRAEPTTPRRRLKIALGVFRKVDASHTGLEHIYMKSLKRTTELAGQFD